MQSTEPLFGATGIQVPERRGYGGVGKRVLDLFIAVMSLPFLLPIIGICWAMARSDGGPGFFAHTRMGKDGRTFRCLKIRTMHVEAEAELAALLDASPEARAEWEETQKLTNDPRVTPLGHVLRKTSLDEFPQIFNVLLGQMSLVGPRPVVETELVRYGPFASIYGSVRPGVTGLWQVSGRNDLSYSERVQLDVDYVSRLSFFGDLWLILLTVREVARRSGV